MPEDSIYEHDNSAFNAQVKRPFYKVLEQYNIPRPIKLTHGKNLKIVQNVIAGSNNIDNHKILQLVYSAKDNAALTPAAYYLVHDKEKNLSASQINDSISILSADAIFFMIKKISIMSPIITTLSDEVMDSLKKIVSNPENKDKQKLQSIFHNLPLDIQRMGLAFFPENIKYALAEKIVSKGIRPNLESLSQQQKDIILADLISPYQDNIPVDVSNTGKEKKMTPKQVIVALQKYPVASRNATLNQFHDTMIKNALKAFYERQLLEINPNVFMIFIDGTDEQLREYSKLIEDETAKGKSSVDLTNEQKKFFESMVAVSVSTKEPFPVTLHTGIQSSAAFPIPAEIDNNTFQVSNNARLLLTHDGGIKDIGDPDNRILPDIKATTYYGAMHQISHALKLKHKDSMFYAPEETKRFEALQALPLKGLVAVKDLPSLQPSKVNVLPKSQQRSSPYQGRYL